MSRSAWALVAALLSAPAPVLAVSGQSLLGWCEAHLRETDKSVRLSPARSSAGAACLGYISAVVDTIQIAQERKQWKLNVCGVSDLPTVALARTYVAWARENPSRLDEPAANGLARALNRAYRCD